MLATSRPTDRALAHAAHPGVVRVHVESRAPQNLADVHAWLRGRIARKLSAPVHASSVEFLDELVGDAIKGNHRLAREFVEAPEFRLANSIAEIERFANTLRNRPDLIFSDELEQVVAEFDDDWDESIAGELPFPVAYAFERSRAEGASTDFVHKDLLFALVRYLALIGMSDYLHCPVEPDIYVNDRLQKLGGASMRLGDWFDIAAACARRTGQTRMGVLRECWQRADEGPYRARLRYPQFGIDVETGLLQTLVRAHDEFLAPEVRVSQADRNRARSLLWAVIRAVIAFFRPLWRYQLVHTIVLGSEPRTLVLEGARNFEEIAVDPQSTGFPGYLRLEGRFVIPVHPLGYLDRGSGRGAASLVDAEAELYLLSQIARSKIPVYRGLRGRDARPARMVEPVNSLLAAKRVWVTRLDLEMDQVLEFARRKLADRVTLEQRENRYNPGRFVERRSLSRTLEAFLEDDEHPALFLSGPSGAGKSTAMVAFLDQIRAAGHLGILLRADEFERDVIRNIVQPKRLERLITAELAFTGTLHQLLGHHRRQGAQQFLVIVDGLNEFAKKGTEGAAGYLVQAIDRMIAESSSAGGLKVVITCRSDTVHSFLPHGQLPPDVDPAHWYPAGESHVWALEPLTDEEAATLVSRLGADPSDAAYLLAGGADLRTPRLLSAATQIGADANDVITGDQRITEELIRQRLGGDKELRRTLDDLVRTLAKANDLCLSELELAKAAPKLSKRLQTDGNRQLDALRQAGLIRVQETRDAEGLRGWSISVAHDSVFEALLRSQRLRVYMRSVIQDMVSLAVLCALIFILPFPLMAQIKQKMLDIAVEIESKVSSLGLESSIQQEVTAAYHSLYLVLADFGFGTLSAWVGAMQQAFTAMAAIIFLPLLLKDAVKATLRSDDSRDPRIVYVCLEVSSKNSSFIWITLGPVVLASFAWALFYEFVHGSIDDQGWRTFAIATTPLCALALILLLGGGLFSAAITIRNAKTGSQLLKEYLLSREALERRRKDGLSGIALLASGLFLTLLALQVRVEWFVSEERIRTVKASAVAAITLRELEIVRKYPISRETEAPSESDLDVFLTHTTEKMRGTFSGSLLSHLTNDDDYARFMVASIFLLFIVLWALGLHAGYRMRERYSRRLGFT